MGQNTRKKLPMLDNIRVATPCSESWDGMVGDEKVRFCGGCMKNVYNLSAMTTSEAEEVIEEKEGDLCIRLYRRKDGTIINADCPVGLKRKKVTKIAAAALAFGGAGLAMALLPTPEPEIAPCDIPTSNHRETKRTATPGQPGGGWLYELFDGSDEPEPAEVMMGDMAEVPVPEMGEPAPERHMMGRMAPPPSPKDDQVPQL